MAGDDQPRGVRNAASISAALAVKVRYSIVSTIKIPSDACSILALTLLKTSALAHGTKGPGVPSGTAQATPSQPTPHKVNHVSQDASITAIRFSLVPTTLCTLHTV